MLKGSGHRNTYDSGDWFNTVFNGSAATVDQKLAGMSGADLALSPVQSAGADPVVKTSGWNSGTSTLSVPARTVAVFVQH